MSGHALFDSLLIGLFVLAPIVFFSLLYTTAPYGRHDGKAVGPRMPVRPAWVVMEAPSVFAFVYFFTVGGGAADVVPLVLCAMWLAHYVHRTLIYPFQMRVGRNKHMAVAVVAMGFGFNAVNSYLNASWIGRFGSYSAAWLADPRFIVGAGVFAAGYVINRHADAVLRGLRAPGDTGYKIPSGGLYRWVTSPNYLGELMTWTGWAIATWSLAGLSFAVFTAANLVPRAIANHRWYKEKFPEYPAERRAIFPYLL